MEHEALVSKLVSVLKSAMPGCQVIVNWDEHEPTAWAVVRWTGFEGMDHLDRQLKMWRAVKAGLTAEERAAVQGLFGETPAEYEAIAGS